MSMFGTMISAPMQAMMTENTNAMNYRIAKMTNKTNVELAKAQNQWNIDQWLRENEYNDPKNQVQRLQGAGLSQAGASQAIEGAGNAAHLESANLANQQIGAPMQTPDMMGALSGLNLIQTAREFMQLKNDMLQNKKLENEVDFQVPFMMSDLDAKEFANKLSFQKLVENWQSMPYNVNYLKWKSNNEKDQNQNLKMARKIMRIQHKQMRQQYNFLEDWNDKQLQEIAARITNLGLEGDNLKKQGKLIETQEQNVAANTAKTNAETENIEADTEGKKTQNNILKHEEVIAECRKILVEHGSPSGQAEQLAAFIDGKHMTKEQCYNFLKELRTVLNFGYSALFQNTENEYVKEYFENVYSQGSSLQGGFGLHQQGFYRPFTRGSGYRSLFQDLLGE